ADDGGKLFSVGDYVTELRVPEDSSHAGATLHNLLTGADAEEDVVVLALIRDGKRNLAPTTFSVLRGGDLLLVEAGTDALQEFLDKTQLELANVAGVEEDEADDPEGDGGSVDEPDEPALAEGDVRLLEAVIAPESVLIGQTANRLNLREQRGLNIVAVARQGQRLEKRLGDIRFQSGDILLVQGHEQTLRATLQNLGCLPLAERGLRFGQERSGLLSGGLFLTAITLIVAGWLSPPVALVACAVVMVLAGVLSHQEAYRAIDWPVIVLLAAMIPVGQALESTGAASLIASWMLELGSGSEPWLVIALVLAGTMLLSNVVNNAAAAILVAPIALSIASQLNVSSDALLMAVAIGASCAFLTPVGHQSNALVMEPGGYRFGDYWRLGLPLSVIVTLVATPLILMLWA
ncbi:SLC13 family permease, partial [Marinobacter sp.]